MNVLLLGDSHTLGFYGQALAQLFKGMGADVTVVANAGAAAVDYLAGGKHAAQVPTRLSKPLGFDIAVITLGTNDAAASDNAPPGTSADRLKSLADALPSSNVWYVGPPAFSAQVAAQVAGNLNTRAGAILNEALKRFGFRTIDSRPSTVGGGDLAPQGEAWAQAVFKRTTAKIPKLPVGEGGGKATSIPPWAYVAGIALLWWAFAPKKKQKS